MYSRISAPTRQLRSRARGARGRRRRASRPLRERQRGDARRPREPRGARARERADAARRHGRHRLPRHARRGRGPRPGRRGGWRGRRVGRGRRRLAREPAEPGPARTGRRGGLRRTWCCGRRRHVRADGAAAAGRRRCVVHSATKGLGNPRTSGRRRVTRDDDLADAWRTRGSAAPGPWTAGCCCGRCGRSTSASLAKVQQHSASPRRSRPPGYCNGSCTPGSLRTRTTPSPKSK